MVVITILNRKMLRDNQDFDKYRTSLLKAESRGFNLSSCLLLLICLHP